MGGGTSTPVHREQKQLGRLRTCPIWQIAAPACKKFPTRNVAVTLRAVERSAGDQPHDHNTV